MTAERIRCLRRLAVGALGACFGEPPRLRRPLRSQPVDRGSRGMRPKQSARGPTQACRNHVPGQAQLSSRITNDIDRGLEKSGWASACVREGREEVVRSLPCLRCEIAGGNDLAVHVERASASRETRPPAVRLYSYGAPFQSVISNGILLRAEPRVEGRGPWLGPVFRNDA
jgi:hypothetical protein